MAQSRDLAVNRLELHMPASRMLTVATFSLLLAVAAPMSALATTQLDESFGAATGIVSPSDWVMADSGAGTCLTAYTSGTPVATQGQATPACGGTPDTDGEGVLRLTGVNYYSSGSILYNQEIATSEGIGVHFFMAMYGGNNLDGVGADGVSFFLKNGADTSTALGDLGARLGYGGLDGALLGVGFDAYGNFSDSNWWDDFNSDSGCLTTGLGPSARTPHSVVLRSGDRSLAKNGSVGFCYLGGTSDIDFSGTTRLEAAKEFLVTVDPATDPTPMVRVYIGPAGELPAEPTLTAAAPSEYLAASTFKFGFAASTGLGTNYHEIWGVRVGEKESVRTFLTLPSTDRGEVGVSVVLVILAGLTAAAGVGLSAWGARRA